MTNRQDRRFARRQPPEGLSPGMGAMNQSYMQIGNDPAADAGLAVAHSQKYLIRVLTMAVCVSLALFFWSKIPWPAILPIKRVQIAGNFVHLSPAELEKKAANIIRGGFITVNVAGIKQELLQEGWISEVTVRRVWPDNLMIFITEHEPVALWGSNALISNEASIFSPPHASFPPGLPFLSGPQGSEEMVLKKYEFLKKELKRRDMEIEMLVLTERRAWQFKLADGPVVLLGRKDVADRFKRFFSFAIPYQADRLLQAKSIDMRYTNGFAVKWTKESKSIISG